MGLTDSPRTKESAMLRKLHDPADGRLRVVALMSGSGTNLQKVLEHQQHLQTRRGESPFEVVAIFSDRSDSNAADIGKRHDIPVVIHDIGGFYEKRGLPRRDMSVRAEFDRRTVDMLRPFGATVAVYAGYMSIATLPLIEAYMGVNVHPADLSVEENGQRKWTGDYAVRDAIVAGEKHIYSTTHMVSSQVDAGSIFMISAPLEVQLPENPDFGIQSVRREIRLHNQNRLKEAGDWIIMPRTIEYIADGRFARDDRGIMHFDGRAIPTGLRLQS